MSNPNGAPAPIVDPTLEQIERNTAQTNQRLEGLGRATVGLALGAGETHRAVQANTTATEAVGLAVGGVETAVTTGLGDIKTTLDTHATDTKAGFKRVGDTLDTHAKDTKLGLQGIDTTLTTHAADTKAGFTAVTTGLGNVHNAVNTNGANTAAGLTHLATQLAGLTKAMTPGPRVKPRDLLKDMMRTAGAENSYVTLKNTEQHHHTADPAYYRKGTDGEVHLVNNDASRAAGVTGVVYGNTLLAHPRNPFGYTTNTTGERIASKRAKVPLQTPLAPVDNFGTIRRARARFGDRNRNLVSRLAGGAAQMVHGAMKAPSEAGLQIVHRGRELQRNRNRNFLVRHAAGIGMRIAGAGIAVAGSVLHPANAMPGRLWRGGRVAPPPNPVARGVRTRHNRTQYR